MNDIELMKQKIAKVEKDLANINQEENSEKKRITLIDYIAYLKGELKELENEHRSRKSTK